MRSLLVLALLATTATAAPDPLAAIPARYPGIAWFGGHEAPILAYTKQLPDLPKCVDEQIATIDGYFQAVVLQGPSLIAFRGRIVRAKLEACIEEVLAKVPFGAHLERDGAFTILAGKTRSQYLAWGKDGTVYYGDKAQLDEALAGTTSLATNKDVMAIVARVDRKRQMWVAAAADYTSKLLGVPSMGFFFAGDALPAAAAPKKLPITIVFASAADAKKAAVAIAAAAHDKRFSAGLQETLAKLDPVAKGKDVLVDVVPLFLRLDLMQEMTALVLQVK